MTIRKQAAWGWLCLAAISFGACTTQRVSTRTEVTCENGYPGDVVVASPDAADLARFIHAHCTTIRGDLRLDGYTGHTLPDALKEVSVVLGTVSVQHTALTQLALPKLREVGGEPGRARGLLIAHNHDLVTIAALPALSNIAGDLAIADNDALIRAGQFPALQTIGGTLAIGQNASLSSIPTFPLLDAVTHLFIVDNPALGAEQAQELAHRLNIRGADPPILQGNGDDGPRVAP